MDNSDIHPFIMRKQHIKIRIKVIKSNTVIQ